MRTAFGFASLWKYRLIALVSSYVSAGTNKALFKGPATSSKDTLFVLGTGSSADLLTQRHFAKIRGGYSVGINFWTLHSFVPNIYAAERGHPSNLISSLAPLVDSGRSAAPVIFFGRLDRLSIELIREIKKLGSTVSFYPALRLRSRTVQQLKKDLSRYLYALKNLSSARDISIDSHSTVSRLVTMGLLAGWKKIVLVGIDLGGEFFEPYRRYSMEFVEDALRAKYFGEEQRSSPTHATDREELGVLRTSQFLRVLVEVAEQDFGANLYSASKSLSDLTGLEEYDWES